jgi:hypothetical protein
MRHLLTLSAVRRRANVELVAGFVTLAFACTSARAVSLEAVGHWGGVCRALAVEGDWAYVGFGASLVVFDVSDPAHPIATGQAILEGIVEDVAISGKYVYVVGGWSGVRVVDISSPAKPVLVGGPETPGSPLTGQSAEVVQGGKMYVAHEDGFEILDVSDSLAPIRLGGYGMARRVRQAVVENARAYIGTESTLRVLDLADLSLPQQVGEFGDDLPPSCTHLAAAGDRAYVLLTWLMPGDPGYTSWELSLGLAGTRVLMFPIRRRRLSCATIRRRSRRMCRSQGR